MQLLGLFGYVFDAVVVEVEKYIPIYFFQIGSGHTVAKHDYCVRIEPMNKPYLGAPHLC